MPEPALPTPEPLHGYQLRVVQEVLLALLAGEPGHGYQLRARLALALGPLADALNDGQVYVTLTRLEKAGLPEPDRSVAALLLEGVVLRLQADLRWLESCARYWNQAKER